MRDEDRGALAAVEVTVSSLALVGSVVVIGLAVSWVRLAAARLPFDLATSALGVKALFGVGVRSVAAMAVVFAALCLFAYLSSARKWDVNGQDWHDIVREGGVASARGRDGYWSEHEAREAYGEKIRHGRRADRLEIPVRLTSWFGPLHSRLEAARGAPSGGRAGAGPDASRSAPGSDRRSRRADPRRLQHPRHRRSGRLLRGTGCRADPAPCGG